LAMAQQKVVGVGNTEKLYIYVLYITSVRQHAYHTLLSLCFSFFLSPYLSFLPLSLYNISSLLFLIPNLSSLPHLSSLHFLYF
jgi:hypothetical protein